jgi:hypothetical protein
MTFDAGISRRSFAADDGEHEGVDCPMAVPCKCHRILQQDHAARTQHFANQIRPGVAAMWPTPRAPLNKVLSWWNETPQIW